METQDQIVFTEPKEAPAENANNPAPIAENAVAQAQVKYAGFWIRWVANFIDGLVLIVPSFIAVIILNGLSLSLNGKVISRIVSLLITWIYSVLMINGYQATLGKMAVGIRVVSDKSEKLTIGQIILRETIGKLISMIILFIGYIMAAFTERKQALHDKIANTVVIYNDPNKKTSTWVFLVVLILPFFAILGILASIVLVSLNSARNKAQDAGVKSIIQSNIPAALLYQDDKGTLNGFVPSFNFTFKDCNGQPIVNISPDGKNMAIFAKLCDKKSEGKYFCDDLNSKATEVDESYAKSGATACKP